MWHLALALLLSQSPADEMKALRAELAQLQAELAELQKLDTTPSTSESPTSPPSSDPLPTQDGSPNLAAVLAALFGTGGATAGAGYLAWRRMRRKPDGSIEEEQIVAFNTFPFKTGARRTPAHKIAEAIATGKAGVHRACLALPVTVARVPKTLSMLGNDQEGDCVTSESCAAIEAYSVGLGLPEIVVTDKAALDWAAAHGDSNGAELLPVIQDMEKDGVTDSTGAIRKAGKPSTVDYTNEATLQSAIALGPVSIAIGSGDLPSGAGSKNGWFATSSNGAANDHCVGLWGYGKAEAVWAEMAKVYPSIGAFPSSLAGQTVYLLYTWSTVGLVTHGWIKGTVQEAWVRDPTTVGLSPGPGPTPTPGTFTPPFSLWVLGFKVPMMDNNDLSTEIAAAQMIINLIPPGTTVDVVVKDANGQLAWPTPTPTPTPPPGPTPPPTPVVDPTSFTITKPTTFYAGGAIAADIDALKAKYK